MPAAEHERYRRGLHSRDQLRNRQTRLDIAADRIEQYEQPVDVIALLNRCQLGQNVLVFGGFHGFRRFLMPLNGSDDRDAVDGAAAGCGGHNAGVLALWFVCHCCFLPLARI